MNLKPCTNTLPNLSKINEADQKKMTDESADNCINSITGYQMTEQTFNNWISKFNIKWQNSNEYKYRYFNSFKVLGSELRHLFENLNILTIFWFFLYLMAIY